MRSRLYRIGGVRVRSTLDLGADCLPLDDAAGPVDVTVTSDPIPHAPEADAAGLFVLEVPGVARYGIRGGCEIRVAAEAGAAPRDVELFLLGSAFAVLWHQRGLLPLHASAVQVGAGCVALVGPAGRGKSTLAAFLARCGYPLLSDDVTVVSLDAAGQPIAHGGFPRIKLWADGLRALRVESGDLQRVRERQDKYFLAAGPATASLPLWRIYQLEDGDASGAPSVARVGGVDAVSSIGRNVYRAALGRRIGRAAQIFEWSVKLAASTAVYRFERARGFDRLDRAIEALEAHWAACLVETR